MASRRLLRNFRTIIFSRSFHFTKIHSQQRDPISPLFTTVNPSSNSWWAAVRNLSYGTVKLVVSEGKTKFETHEVEPSKREKWKTKKRLKLQRLRDRRKRREANTKDPRRVRPKGNKKLTKFSNAEDRLLDKLEKAKIKEGMLIEKLKRYEVPKLQGPSPKPIVLTGEERFFMKKMAQKRSNYVPVGRRGLFGGVILNMHMHWKKHETVKVICKPCKPGQVQEYADEIARLSGGIPIHVIGNDTIVFYRGKDYEQPEVMSPIDTLSKKKALEKSKYEQSLESVRQFIAITEKELELYRRHVSLYGETINQNPNKVFAPPKCSEERQEVGRTGKDSLPEMDFDSMDEEDKDDYETVSDVDSDGEFICSGNDELDSCNESDSSVEESVRDIVR